jgi:hypothetical protein
MITPASGMGGGGGTRSASPASGTGGNSPASGTGGNSPASGTGGSSPTSGTGGRGGTTGGKGGSMSTAGSGGADSMSTPTDAGVDAQAAAACDSASLQWRTANKTNYTSYPDPGSEECVKFNGCTWAGQFAACDDKKSEPWVMTHNIVAAFPDFKSLKLHDLCLRAKGKTIVVTVYDTCGDSDCDGCCTENRGSADQLIDIESYTNERWGVSDGMIEWADLGPTQSGGCD